MSLTVVTWFWRRPDGNSPFSARHVQILRSMLARRLSLPHELVCVTDQPDDPGLAGIRTLPIVEFADSIRCRRRLAQYSADFPLQGRLLSIDLDMVLTDDITPLIDRPEPIVMWRVGYAGALSGSFVLWDAGALDGAYQSFARNPERCVMKTGERNASDQAILNHWLADLPIGEWQDSDGIVPWFGNGYGHLQHHGMGPDRPDLLPGTRMVVLGSADLDVLEEGRYDWVREHWR